MPFPVWEFFLQLTPEWYANYTAFLIAIIGIFFLLVFNSMISQEDVRIFRAILIVLVVAAVVENINHCMGTIDTSLYPNTTYARTIFALLTFSFRPVITMLLLLSVSNNRKAVGTWIWIPAALVVTILLCDLIPNNQFFYVNADQDYVWLNDYSFIAIFNYVVTYTYLLGVVVAAVFKFKIKNIGEGIAILAVFLLVVAGYVIQDILVNNDYYEARVYGLGTQAASVAAFFIYVLYIMKHASTDPLTGLFNRQSYYVDIKQNKNKISAAVSIDMNGLKTLNDECGHAKGDEALTYIAKGIKSSLKKGAKAYRTGGDEFVILCQGMDFIDVDDMVDEIQEKINVNGEYNVAIGYAIKKESWQEAHNLVLEADKIMYQNKSALKSAQAEANANDALEDLAKETKKTKKKKSPSEEFNDK